VTRDSLQQIQQLVNDDLTSVSNYYIKISSKKRPGVLLVNYYLSSDLVGSNARLLKKSQIS
jgi:hypothetical protein